MPARFIAGVRRHAMVLGCVLACSLILAAPSLLSALQDSTATTPTDHTGILGPLIDYWFMPAIVFLQSLAAKGIALATPAWTKLSAGLKYTILYGLGLLITFVGAKIGFIDLHVTGDTLAQLGSAGVLATFPTAAAALVYKFGGHKVPPPPPETAFR